MSEQSTITNRQSEIREPVTDPFLVGRVVEAAGYHIMELLRGGMRQIDPQNLRDFLVFVDRCPYRLNTRNVNGTVVKTVERIVQFLV
jgi:hypothetical protein